VYAAPPMQQPVPMLLPRVQRHLQTLGILWCVYGVFRFVTGLIGMFFLRAFMGRWFVGDNWPMGPWVGMHGTPWMGVMPVIFTFALLSAALALLVGYSLLTRRPWGRILSIVIAILSLIKFPVGTALGIYTLWVLAPSVSGMEYDAIADRS
jgi:hypothetical protein